MSIATTLKRKPNKPQKRLVLPKDLKNSRTLFQEIDHYLQSEQREERPDSPHSRDSLDDTLDAFSDPMFSNRSRSTTLNGQLQYIQEVFAQFEKPPSPNSTHRNLSTEDTSEGEAMNFSMSSCYQFESRITPQNFTAYEINPQKIDLDARTTLMIRNIPSEYTRDMLMDEVNLKFGGKYDFLNLPYDYKLQLNAGYAFINFKEKVNVKEFYNYFNGKRWRANLIAKPCYLRYARVQGKQRLMSHKRGYKPIFFYQKEGLSQIQQLVQSQRQQCDLMYV